MKIVYKDHWEILKGFIKKLCCCCRRRDVIVAQASFAGPGINDTEEHLLI